MLISNGDRQASEQHVSDVGPFCFDIDCRRQKNKYKKEYHVLIT